MTCWMLRIPTDIRRKTKKRGGSHSSIAATMDWTTTALETANGRHRAANGQR